jgi:hypothetical protein
MSFSLMGTIFFFQKKTSLRAMSASCNGAAVDLSGTSSANPINIASTNYPNRYPNNQK